MPSRNRHLVHARPAEAGVAALEFALILPALLLWNDPATAAAELAERVVRPVAGISR